MARGNGARGGRFGFILLAIALTLTGLVAAVAHPFLGQSAHAQAAAPKAPVIRARLDCLRLVQDGVQRDPAVANFQDIPGAPTRVTSAKIVPATAGQPEYCEVNGYVQPQVKFQLKLPTATWQGRYLQVGCGGYCGFITPTTFPSCRIDLGGDFAVAATNTGHDSASLLDGLWAGKDEQSRIDYGYRGVHVVAVASKAIIAAYYGRGPTYSYYTGCSDGGREGLMEVQRYPEDFDGVLAGAPAQLQTFNPLYMIWSLRANTDAKGRAILTTEKLAPLHAAVVKACDGNDGVLGDGLIGDPRACAFNPRQIQCSRGDGPNCLTAAQVKVVNTFYSGIFDTKGNRLDPRIIPRGSEMAWAGFWVPRAGQNMEELGSFGFGENGAQHFAFPLGQGKPLQRVELTVDEYRRLASQAKYYEPLDPDLKAFRQRGGKLLMYSGWADWGVTPSQTLMYYDAVRKVMGGQEETDRFARLFMVPGMSHCFGGPAPDTSEMLLQLVRWVEEGAAPERITARDREPEVKNPRLRPVYRYPLVAKYTGASGDVAGANTLENYRPEAPARAHVDSSDWVGQELLAPGYLNAQSR